MTRQKPPLWSATHVRPSGSTSAPVEMCRPVVYRDEPVYAGGPAPQPGAEAGSSERSTLKRPSAEVGLTLPAASVAVTWKVCSPAVSKDATRPGRQDSGARPSTEQVSS